MMLRCNLNSRLKLTICIQLLKELISSTLKNPKPRDQILVCLAPPLLLPVDILRPLLSAMIIATRKSARTIGTSCWSLSNAVETF